jgi:hypothetical protein
MNKLTTINTIKKAAPLALLAVVLSGSAFAGGRNANTGGASIDMINKCEIADEEVKDYYGNVIDVIKVLKVTTTITDSSDDTPGGGPSTPPDLGYITVYGKQKAPRGPWQDFGQAMQPANNDLTKPNVETIPLCGALDPNAMVLNAEVEVELNNGKRSPRKSKCNNWNPLNDVYDADGNLIGGDDSIVDVPPNLCD